MQNLPPQFISQTKDFFWIFYCVSEMCRKFRAFSPTYFRSDWCWKTWLLNCLKGLASEDHSLMNVLTGSKHCWNQHGTPSVWYEILRLFVNALTFDDKYSIGNMQNLPQLFQVPLSHKTKDFLSIFYCISEMCIKFRAFPKKRWVSSPNYLWNYWCWKTWLLKRVKVLLQNTIS